ncbi:MAG: exodeoxyribonuclease VII small subunit [Chlorobiota bacterium]|jgi:exodeoxyribonuclease VII small subunit
MAKKINIEENINKLEEIIKEIDSEELTLDEQIKKYEEGIKIIKSSRDYIENTKQKVNNLTDQIDE